MQVPPVSIGPLVPSNSTLDIRPECCLPDDDRWLGGPTVHPMTYYDPPAKPTAWKAPCVDRFRGIGRNIMFVAGDLLAFMTLGPAYVFSKRISVTRQVSSYRLSLSMYQFDPNTTCLPYGAQKSSSDANDGKTLLFEVLCLYWLFFGRPICYLRRVSPPILILFTVPLSYPPLGA